MSITNFSVRKEFDPSGEPGARAMRWDPGDDPLATGHLIGWLMAVGAEFSCLGGRGASTTLLAINTPDGQIIAEPGDWVIGMPGAAAPDS